MSGDQERLSDAEIDALVNAVTNANEPVSSAAIRVRIPRLSADEAVRAAVRLLERRRAETTDPAYDAEVSDELCRQMRAASGMVDLENPLARLLYLLARDVVSVSVLEELADRAALTEVTYPVKATNGWLAGWANWTAARIVDGG